MDLKVLIIAGVIVLGIWCIKPGTVSSFKLKIDKIEVELLTQANKNE